MADAPVSLARRPRGDRTTHLLLVLVLTVQLVSLALDLSVRGERAGTCVPGNLGSLFPAEPDPRCP